MEITAIFLIFKLAFSVAMHSDVYPPVLFTLGMLVDTAELYILILILVTSTLI